MKDRESQRKPRVQNPFCQYHTCKHCGKRIGHRPHTRDWEHIHPNPIECDHPWPETGWCGPKCDGCKQSKKGGKKN